MLTIDHLEKCFGSTVLFRDLTFTVDGPAVLWAPSGWGKTTLLRILMGLETPTAGRVQGAGRVSAVFQEDRLCPQLTAVQNVLLVLPDDRQEATIRQDFARLGLDEAALALPARKLSGGQKRRTAPATLKMDTEATQDEDYALADKISTQMQKIKGVKTVGVMKGSTSGAMSSANSDKIYSFMILLDEKYANSNKKIASKMESVFKKNKCKDYSVSDSNMDMSSLMGSGLQVNIYGKDSDKLIKISEDVMKMAKEVKGFEKPSTTSEESFSAGITIE